MNDYINKPFFGVDYCKYADWGYRKRTRIWTNIKDFDARTRKKYCNSMDGNKHKVDVSKHFGGGSNRVPRYGIPPQLIEELFNCIV